MSIPTHPSQFVDSSQFEESLRVEDGFRDDVESIINSENTNALYRENSSSIRLEEKRFFKGIGDTNGFEGLNFIWITCTYLYPQSISNEIT